MAAVLVAVAVVPAARAADPAFSPPTALEPALTLAGDPLVAINAGGDAAVALPIEQAYDADTIDVIRRSAGGTWGQAQNAVARVPRVRAVSLRVDAAGRTIVTWIETPRPQKSATKVAWARVAPRGGAFGPRRRISTVSPDALVVADAGAGRSFVAYVPTTGPRTVTVALLSASGAVQRRFDTGEKGVPADMVATANGRALLTWTQRARFSDDTATLRAAQVRAAGGLAKAHTVVTQVTSSALVADGGNVVLSYAHSRRPRYPERPFSRVLLPSLGAAQPIPGGGGSTRYGPVNLALGANGRRLAVWGGSGEQLPDAEFAAFGQGDAWGRALALDAGSPTPDAESLPSEQLVSQGSPFLLSDGTAIVLWGVGFQAPVPLIAVAAPGETAFGPATSLAPGGAGIVRDSDEPRIATAASGNAIVAGWRTTAGGVTLVTRGPGTGAPTRR